MPTSFATPRYIGYWATATERSPNTSGNFGQSGRRANPRSRTMLAGVWSASRSRAASTKRRTRDAVACAAAASAFTGSGGSPT